MGYNLLINGVYWSCNPFTNHLLASWDIQTTSQVGAKYTTWGEAGQNTMRGFFFAAIWKMIEKHMGWIYPGYLCKMLVK